MTLSSKIRALMDISRQEGLLSAFQSLSDETKKSILGKRFFSYMTALRYRKQQLLYDAPAHPYKKIFPCPDQIEYYNKEIETHWGLGIIEHGEWDCPDNCSPIRNTTHYRGLQQRFEEGLDWEDTAYVQQRLLNEGSECLSDRRRERLNYFEDLFYDIQQNGYRSNSDSRHDAPEGGNRQGRLKHVHVLEVLVTIGRDGELYLNEGFHRCAIANFLDIDEIPVNVLARHEEWQKKREMIHAVSNPNSVPHLERYVSHPDMRDIVRA